MRAIGKAAPATRNGSSTRDNNVLLKTLIAFKRGNFAIRMPVDETGVPGKIADTLNEILELNQKMVSEFARISKAVGKDGKIKKIFHKVKPDGHAEHGGGLPVVGQRAHGDAQPGEAQERGVDRDLSGLLVSERALIETRAEIAAGEFAALRMKRRRRSGSGLPDLLRLLRNR